jgi:pilus assembly protein Flp/PilA
MGVSRQLGRRGLCDHSNEPITAAVLSTGIMQTLKAFLRDESGATAIEYGLIAAGISIAIIATVKGLGTKLNSTFSSVSTQLK